MTFLEKIQAASTLPADAGHTLWEHISALGAGVFGSSVTSADVQGGAFVSVSGGVSVRIDAHTTVEKIDG